VEPDARIEDVGVGVQQRVEILKALYRGAEVLILDEPTAVLTPQEVEDLFDVLEELTDAGKTVIFITHDVEEAVYLSEKVLIMTRHPGTKKDVIDIDLDRTRPREEIVTSDEFSDVKNAVWKQLREETQPEVQV